MAVSTPLVPRIRVQLPPCLLLLGANVTRRWPDTITDSPSRLHRLPTSLLSIAVPLPRHYSRLLGAAHTSPPPARCQHDTLTARRHRRRCLPASPSSATPPRCRRSPFASAISNEHKEE
uniref:Uncharacterized protein n=1 Tax=Oryza punctata TaxID=4537 RepID=A0A0E0MAG3_ORYPU